jgi:hypothetical protein
MGFVPSTWQGSGWSRQAFTISKLYIYILDFMSSLHRAIFVMPHVTLKVSFSHNLFIKRGLRKFCSHQASGMTYHPCSSRGVTSSHNDDAYEDCYLSPTPIELKLQFNRSERDSTCPSTLHYSLSL